MYRSETVKPVRRNRFYKKRWDKRKKRVKKVKVWALYHPESEFIEN
ncbi:MAG: hypothetical protein AAF363_12560 [Bacteroidota bacterium]